jgi:hypothetical protein
VAAVENEEETMNKKNAMSLAASLGAAAWLSACSNLPQTPALLDCTLDNRGPTTITYGVQNSKTIFEVKEKIKVKKGRGLVFKLKPKNTTRTGIPDFKAAMVTIKGKASDPKNSWFTAISGSFDSTVGDGHKLGICADASEGTYEYEIHVVDLGTLDPRVDVVK